MPDLSASSEWSNPERVAEYLSREIPHRQTAEALLLEALPARVDRLLDLGTGDGRLIALVMTRFPDLKATGLDSSPPMLSRAAERLGDTQVELLHHDLDLPLPRLAPCDVVVSGLAIHHVADERKRTLFEEVHDVLRPGGVFVNLDLVASATPELHERFRREIGRVEDDPADRLADLGEQLTWLRDAGFDAVDCHFKWLELALVVASRHEGTRPDS